MAARFVRLEAIGPLIADTDYYKITLDMAVEHEKGDFASVSMKNGLDIVKMSLKPIYDPTSGYHFQAAVVNILGDLPGET